jgi:hypothetical protein
MYYYLTSQVQRTIIDELRRYWSYHPKYKDELVDNIQGKYSFEERPQHGIVVLNSSANQVQLAPDNFQGTIESYINLAHVPGYSGVSIEWVRENHIAIQKNGGVFPLHPGIYYIDLCDANGRPTDKEFYVDPLLNVFDETVAKISPTQYQLLNQSYLQGTLKLWLMPGSIPLVEGINYTSDPETGLITLLTPVDDPDVDFLSADYKYVGESTGPWKINEERALIEPLRGVTLSFGRRVTPGDRLAVVVGEKRGLSALEYGGRWELNLDIQVVSRDPTSQREILDQSMMHLWVMARPRLSTDGVEILSISSGGESEETYDDNADDYYYTANFSMTIQTDWAVRVPVSICVGRVSPESIQVTDMAASMTDEQVVSVQNNFRLLERLGLQPQDPYLLGRVGRYRTFEMLR